MYMPVPAGLDRLISARSALAAHGVPIFEAADFRSYEFNARACSSRELQKEKCGVSEISFTHQTTTLISDFTRRVTRSDFPLFAALRSDYPLRLTTRSDYACM